MVMPTYGLPETVNSFPVPLLNALYQYAALEPMLANDLQRAQIAAGAQVGAANASAQGGIKQQQIQAASDWRQLLPALAQDYQNQLLNSWQQAALGSSNNLRDWAKTQFWQAGLAPQPEAGSAIPNIFSEALSGPLAFLDQVKAATGGGGGGGGGGARSGSGSGGVNYPTYTNPIPTYSAANGFSANRRGNYDILTGDRQLMSTGIPSGNEEIVRVGPNNRLQGVMPLRTNPNTGAQYNRSGYRVGGGVTGGDDDGNGGGGSRWSGGQSASDWQIARALAVMRAGGGAPATFLPGEAVGNRPATPPLPYGNDVVATNITPISGIPYGNDVVATNIDALGRPVRPLYSAASGFTPPQQPAAAPAPAPAWSPDPTANNLPTLLALRSGQPRVQTGYAPGDLKEIGIGTFPNPMMAAGVFQRSNPAEQSRMIELWRMQGIEPQDALAQILGFTPGMRFSQPRALSYA